MDVAQFRELAWQAFGLRHHISTVRPAPGGVGKKPRWGSAKYDTYKNLGAGSAGNSEDQNLDIQQAW